MSTARLQQAIESIADKYHCDPLDPLFCVLEKMDQYHEDLKQDLQASSSGQKQELKELIQTFQIKADELSGIALKLSCSGNVFEKNAQVVGESTQNLSWHYKNVGLKQALAGMGVTFLLCFGLFTWFYSQSAARLLSQAGVVLRVHATGQGHKISLSGHKLLGSGRSEHELVGEFQ